MDQNRTWNCRAHKDAIPPFSLLLGLEGDWFDQIKSSHLC